MQVKFKSRLPIIGCLLVCSTATGETTIRDNLYASGILAPVAGVMKPGGKWERAAFRVFVGLEKYIPGRARGFDSYQMVVDLRAVAPATPAGCGTKLAAPWKDIRAQFPIDKEVPSTFPAEYRLPRKREDAVLGEVQDITLKSDACKATISFSPPGEVDYILELTSKKVRLETGIDPAWFSPRKLYQIIGVRLEGSGKRSQFTFALPFHEANWR